MSNLHGQKNRDFLPTCQLRYRLRRHNYVIIVTSQTFRYHCVECMKLDTCAKYHDPRSNNNKFMMEEAHAPITDDLKKPMANSVKFILFSFGHLAFIQRF